MLDPELGDAELKIIYDQAAKILPHLARLARTYYLELKKQEFTDRECIHLTADYIATISGKH